MRAQHIVKGIAWLVLLVGLGLVIHFTTKPHWMNYVAYGVLGLSYLWILFGIFLERKEADEFLKNFMKQAG